MRSAGEYAREAESLLQSASKSTDYREIHALMAQAAVYAQLATAAATAQIAQKQ